MMVLLGFFQTTEFYVIMAVVAAAIVAAAARPQSRGVVTEHLLGSYLEEGPLRMPELVFECRDDGHVLLTRLGVEGVSMNGAVSLAVETDGVNVVMKERLVPGSALQPPAVCAVFDIDFLREGRYHVRYDSESTGLFGAFSLHVRPGIVAHRTLSR